MNATAFRPDIHKINAANYPEQRIRALIGSHRYNQAKRLSYVRDQASQMNTLRGQYHGLLFQRGALSAETFTAKINANKARALSHAATRRHWLNEYRWHKNESQPIQQEAS
jgi:hypothetical protein